MITTLRARSGPIAGLAFVVLAAGGLILLALHAPGNEPTNAEIVDYYKGHKNQIESSTPVLGLASFFLVWFLVAVSRAVSGREDRSASAIVPAGAVLGLLLMLAAGVAGTIPGALDYVKPYAVDPGDGRLLGSLTFHMLYFAAVPAAVVVFAATGAGRRSGVLSRRSATFGWIVGAVCLIGLVTAPIWVPAFGIWVVAVSATVLRPARSGVGSSGSPLARAAFES